MMLDVIVHIPIEKPNQRMQGERPATKAEVGDVVPQADVLCVVAQEKEPAALERGETRQYRQEPPPKVEGDHKDNPMARKSRTRPQYYGSTPFGLVGGEQIFFPLPFKVSPGVAYGRFQDL